MHDRDKIIADNPLTSHLARLGVKLKGEGVNRTATKCPTKQHKPDHWCVSVNVHEQIFHCNDCACGGSIIDWLSIEQGKSVADVLKQLSGSAIDSGTGNSEDHHPSKSKIVATYDYKDENGNLKYQAVRMEPKSFRQRQPDGQGGWKWTMDGITRVLYRLAEVLLASSVWIVEGEKDADTMVALGFVATCNVGGAGKWLASYSDCLNAKEVIVIPDNDAPGKDHAVKITESLSGKAASLKIVEMPSPHKDATDYASAFATKEAAREALLKLAEKTPHTIKPLPIYTIQEMEVRYRESLREQSGKQYDLSKFLASFRHVVRPLVPGELALIFGHTGIGKTAIMQSLARAAVPLPTLLFELELPDELIFERFVQMEGGYTAAEVQSEYRAHNIPFWTGYRGLNHILVCPESGLNPEQIEYYIDRSELKSGVRPALVLIDYIGLVQSKGKSRYEQVSYSAEQMKIIAKRTKTIIIMASQTGRPPLDGKEPKEPHLYSSKDSGSLENSAGLVLGVWRPDAGTICMKVLKNTKGKSGKVIICNFEADKMNINERSAIADEDVPQTGRAPHND